MSDEMITKVAVYMPATVELNAMLRAKDKQLREEDGKIREMERQTSAVAIAYFILHSPIERVVCAVALTFVCIGVAYYIRVKPSTKVNRALYVWLGITPIGFCLWILWGVSGLAGFITSLIGVMPSLLLS